MVRAFAREFINDPRAQTKDRKATIRAEYKRLFGDSLPGTCRTCYVEALLKILKYNQMAVSLYELKKGYVAQFDVAFNGVKAFTNLNLQTDAVKYDAIAAEYLRRYPQRSVYFVRAPKPAPFIPQGIKVEPVPETPKREILEVLPLMPDPEEVIKAMTETPAEVKKVVKNTTKKPK